MKGLLFEEFYSTKGIFKIIIVLTLIYAFLFIPTSGFAAFILMSSAMISGAITGRSLTNDLVYHWSKYVSIMPVGKKDFVLSKYYLLLLSVLGGIFIGLVISIIYFCISNLLGYSNDFNNEFNWIILILAFSYPLLSGSISLVLAFYFGFDKAKLFTIVAYLIPAGLLLLFEDYINLSWTTFKGIIIISPLIALIFWLICFELSYLKFKNYEY